MQRHRDLINFTGHRWSFWNW